MVCIEGLACPFPTSIITNCALLEQDYLREIVVVLIILNSIVLNVGE